MCPTRRPYDPTDRRPRAGALPPRPARPVVPKLLADLDAAFEQFAIGDGATLGFHHHLRNGDAVLNQVLAVAAARGLRDLTIAASSLFPVHAPLAAHIETGVVAAILTGYVTGPVGDAVMAGRLAQPLVLQSHGGRARAIASGELPIDVAFVAAPRADRFGAATGALGRAACGPLGYPMVDADHARAVVVVAEEISDEPLARAEIGPDRVDAVVQVGCIGDPAGILSGSTRAAQDETARRIAGLAAEAVATSGLLVDGFSFQTGAGGPPLAAAPAIGELMRQRGVRGGFISGGITGAHVALARDGLFREIVDVQCFDLDAVQSFRRDPFHRAMSAAEYASPIYPEPVVDRLSAMIVGAAEVDLDFNVNVTVGADGRLIGGPGGHPDAAAGARLTVVTTRMASGAHRKLVDRVICRTTPGDDIDVVATEVGLIVQPAREELRDRYRRAGLPLLAIEQVAGPGYRPASAPDIPRVIVEYRDGSEIDRI